jgi:uncharacterized protein YdeI (YjbR/CyaY-like superfamily)
MEADRFVRVEIQAAQDLWDWLAMHHAQDESIWLMTWKAQHTSRYVSREEVLDALIAHGWIDGRRLKLDDDRTMQLISPRKQQAWADSYKRRAERLETEGQMRPSGRAAIAAAKAVGRWNETAGVDALIVPQDLAAALASDVAADRFFRDAAPSYRRNVLRWLHTAKRAETRALRIARIVNLSADGKKVPQL